MPKETCPRTGKIILTKEKAQRKVQWFQTQFARMMYYRCKSCGGWHIGNENRPGKYRKVRAR